MGGDVNILGIAEARSALAWWLDAGVDALVTDAPRDWLKPAPTASPAGSPAPAAPANIAPPSLDTLAELQQWLANSAELPLAGPAARRILPHGPQQAKVMLLSDSPALEDLAAGQPVGGEAWELAKRMLSAIGISADDAYSASLSCVHSPGARMTPAEREACIEIARQHIRLAKPERLLLFGERTAQALLGKPLLEARGHASKIDGIRTVATFHPRQLLNRPFQKAQAWEDLLLLMEDES